MIETRIQRKLESITSAQVIALRKIYNSLKDGMSKPLDWFDYVPANFESAEVKQPEPTQSYYHATKPKRGRKPKETSEPAVTPTPQPENASKGVSELLSANQGRRIEELLKDQTIIDAGFSKDTICFEWEVFGIERLNPEQADNVIKRLEEVKAG